MAIVKMTNFHLTLFRDKKDALMDALQAFDDVHFNDLSKRDEVLPSGIAAKDSLKTESECLEEISRVEEVIRILSEYAPKPSGLKEKVSDALPAMEFSDLRNLPVGELAGVTEEVLAMQQADRRNTEMIRHEKERIGDLSHWKKLALPLSDVRRVKKALVQFGTVPLRWEGELRGLVAKNTEQTHLEILSTDDKQAYVMLVHTGKDKELPEILRNLNFVEMKLAGEKSIPAQIEERKNEIVRIQEEEKALAISMASLSKEHLLPLKAYAEYLYNRLALLEADQRFLESRYVDFIEGYVPTEKRADFEELVKSIVPEKEYALALEDGKESDPDIPIKLRNHPMVEPFEGMVATYAYPLYSEVDPTPLVVPWYLLFFGMMLGDMAYGLIMLIATTLALKFFNFKKATENSMRFFQMLSIPTIIFGMLFGSAFGFSVKIPYVSMLDPTKDYMTILVISIAIGVINILFGLGILGYKHLKQGKPVDFFAGVVCWYMILIGLILFGLASMFGWSELTAKIFMGVAIAGMIGVLLFSHHEDKGVARYAWGFYEVYGMSSYIGDIVSYSRIVALLLSGAFIAFAVNLIAGMVAGSGIAGMIGAAIIMVIFHAFNLFLSGLSGYVHSMRLIYVEYFGKFYEGGGVPFSGLRRGGKYLELK